MHDSDTGATNCSLLVYDFIHDYSLTWGINFTHNSMTYKQLNETA